MNATFQAGPDSLQTSLLTITTCQNNTLSHPCSEIKAQGGDCLTGEVHAVAAEGWQGTHEARVEVGWSPRSHDGAQLPGWDGACPGKKTWGTVAQLKGPTGLFTSFPTSPLGSTDGPERSPNADHIFSVA